MGTPTPEPSRSGEEHSRQPPLDVRRTERSGLPERVGKRERRACSHSLSLPVERRYQLLGDHLRGIALLSKECVHAVAQRLGFGRPVDLAVEVGRGFQDIQRRAASWGQCGSSRGW